MSLITLAEKRWLPDSIIRIGMRRLLRERLDQARADACDDEALALDRFADRQRAASVTIETQAANEQHYEVPAEFFKLVLGPRLKYSGGLWSTSDGEYDPTVSLDASEEAMLKLTCERAEITDGMRILELGCGWGSLTLWMAEKYPGSSIVALSNSASQRKYIEAVACERGLTNLQVITQDVADFEIDQQFDRVVSVEMFEHVRNHDRLLSRIAGWLVPDGKLFVHIFCHEKFAYTFETDGEKNWMGRHFFSGGIMPAVNLFHRYDRDLAVESQWWIDGRHYAQTCEAWLAKMDACKADVIAALSGDHGGDVPAVMVQRWRMFFMACAELFAYERGRQWGVGHYVFVKRDRNGPRT